MPTQPSAGTPIVAIAQPMEVNGPELSGRAIAMQFTGDKMLYLVVKQKDPGPPIWIEEGEIESAYLADSRR
jgi:hypothetical protein